MDSSDIVFVENDPEKIRSELLRSCEGKMGRTLYPADPAALLADWLTSIDVQQRAYINFAARQNLPRFATGAYLDAVAELFHDVSRIRPAAARTTLEFTLSVPLETSAVIPAGTRVTPDSKIFFATENEIIIPAGETKGQASAICTVTGIAGNDFPPGAICKPVDVFPYYHQVRNLTISAGGADWETDADFYQRIRESMETFSTAGPTGAYEYWAKTASALISDVKAFSPTPGEVDVRILMKDGKLPDEEILRRVQSILSDDRVRPLTDHVTVAAPEMVTYNVDLTWYLEQNSAVSAVEAEKRVQTALKKYHDWQSGRIGRDVNPSRLMAILMESGIKRAEIREPTFTPVNENAVAVEESVSVINGGFEFE